jgi:hypothetical protein
MATYRTYLPVQYNRDALLRSSIGAASLSIQVQLSLDTAASALHIDAPLSLHTARQRLPTWR